jgi:hypothetical protein
VNTQVNSGEPPLDLWVQCAKLKAVMSATRRRNYNYPDKTRGSEAARRIRAGANRLSSAERAEVQQRAMRVIYGGTGNKEAVGAGQQRSD